MLKMYYFMLKLPKINKFCKRMVNFIALNKNVNINYNELYNNFFYLQYNVHKNVFVGFLYPH